MLALFVQDDSVEKSVRNMSENMSLPPSRKKAFEMFTNTGWSARNYRASATRRYYSYQGFGGREGFGFIHRYEGDLWYNRPSKKVFCVMWMGRYFIQIEYTAPATSPVTFDEMTDMIMSLTIDGKWFSL